MTHQSQYPDVLDPGAVGQYPASAGSGGGYDWAEEPLALILQREYIAEPQPGIYVHVKEPRMTEWPVAFLSRPRRTPDTIPNFLSPSAPDNRLDILRGTAK